MIRNHLIAFIGISLVVLSCNSKKVSDDTETFDEAKFVKSSPLVEKEYVHSIYAFGKLAAQEESKLSFKIGGIIRNINVKQGQRVKRGQLLASLDMKEIDAQVASARANFEKWGRDLERMEKLQKEKVVTLESYQNVKTQYDVAASNLQIAEFNQKYAIIKAPMDGKVLRKFSEENELIEPGTPIFLIGSTGSKMVVKAALTDKEVVHLQQGDSASIQFDALPEMDFYGSVLLINSAPEASSGLYETEILLANHHPGLRNGFFAKVQIYPSESKSYHFLPVEALVEAEKDKGFIYAIHDDKVTKVEVTIQGIHGEELIVRNDISAFEEIVVEGAQYLDPGDKVIILNN